jgi:hypothetical protein
MKSGTMNALKPLACSFLLLSGCVATYKRSDLAAPPTKLDNSQTVLIATPTDGFYEGKVYASSGRSTALAVRAAFAKFARSTATSDNCKDLPCMISGSQSSAGYFVVPEILHWEDRATEWSGKPDRIEIKVSIYDAKTMSEVAATVITGKSKWATFGGDHPQDLLTDPLNKYVESLY